MNDQEQNEAIKREAIAAADRGEGPNNCPYLPKSKSAEIWKDAFYGHLGLLLPLPAIGKSCDSALRSFA